MIETRTEQIYCEYKGKVTGYVSGKVSNPQDVEDLVSIVFEKVLKGLSGFDEERASLSTWIYTITRNTVIDHFRTNKVVRELPEQLAEDDGMNLYNQETMMELTTALKELELRERDLIILHYYSGHTLREIAQMMRMSYSNTKNVHKSALCHLKKLMGGL